MKSFYKKSIILLLFVFTTIFLLSGFFFQKNNKDTIEIKSEDEVVVYYKDIILDKIIINDNQYSIKDGHVQDVDNVKINEGSLKDEVLRLSLFYQWSKEYPLFLGSGIDRGRFKNFLDLAEKERQFFIDTTGYTVYPFPVDFYRNLFNLSIVQEKFFNNITDLNANELLVSLNKTLDAYRKNIIDLQGEIIKITAKNDFNFAFLAKVHTNNQLILDDFKKIIKNLELLDGQIKKRKLCLTDNISNCERVFLGYKKNVKDDIAVEEFNGLFLPKNDLVVTPEYSSDMLRGPYIVNTECIREVSTDFNDRQYIYTVIAHNDIIDSDIQFFKSATNNYYTNSYIHIIDSSNGQDLEWRVIPETNPYTCSDFRYLTKIAITDSFLEKYRDKRFFKDLNNDISTENVDSDFLKVVNVGLAVEDRFFESEYPSYLDLKNLSESYAETYSYLMNSGLGEVGHLKDDLLKRFLTVDSGMENIDLIMSNFVFLLSNTAKRYYIEDQIAPHSYVYLVRSSYSLMLLNFSPYIWINDKYPKYYNKISDGYDEYRYTDYKSAVDEFGYDEVSVWGKYNDMPWIFDKLYNEKKEK